MPVVALSPGTKLGRFELTGVVGAGGMGEVYRARDPGLERAVAIKVIPASFADDPVRLHRFEHEARAAAALNHPNILAVHDIGTEDGSPYIVSELLEGETLRERLRSGPLPVRKAIDYALQIARFETLKWQDVPWTREDFKLSDTMATYWTNFAKNGNPNGTGLPSWPRYEPNNSYQVMHLSRTAPHSLAEMYRERYEFLNTEATEAMRLQHDPGTE